MAFMPFMVNRVGPYCTMKSMKVKTNPGNCRGLPCFVRAPFMAFMPFMVTVSDPIAP